MLLTLDVGNSQIHGGVFDGETLRVQFRKSTHPIGSSDEIGLFLRTVLRDRGAPEDVVERWIAHDRKLESVVTDGTDCVSP